ncbi:Uncharacterized protein OS=Singulisphaera acidiphila (strain ATCC BAA-1392 / DSM 18658 / VKM B-2454 / MOB10) GN=Sinac_3101 PE=4 SV=1: DUF1800 [Gemmata massiliana]|uniref:DUF1800 domain-containing protein n=1 Tax=Gemmata massiliana TaxID=1210884 RepID=A0A6P2D7X8_9BACT|nr:DUF1800 domain-containing protein [Gemmata massiliana]VTR97451.1 Uncharacterized protein OS=Singulisphaera acidiphila (strain ATCC BAA-1392 / DSM 18658 / VKM B-2454 / MOB10) GN=Sinac_3101 PE=4 SV=1: DUF1800 [Gemmata massiliana]
MTREPVWDVSAASHLLSRTSFGGTPQQAERLAARPLKDAVSALIEDAQRAPAPQKPAWVKEPWVNTERVYPETTNEERMENHRKAGERQSRERNELRCWWIDHAIRTPAPLREVMTLFWHGHFTTEARRMSVAQPLYTQNAALRAHALGNFRDLLEAVALDAAMMMYLNMEDSDAKKPNENFARELLELFTLGIGNYSETDIKEIARALTGWTLSAPFGTKTRPLVEGAPRAFCRDGLVPTFVKDKHDAGEKTVLGKTGRFGAKEVLDIVATHPATAKFVAGKLVAFFGAADPKNELRDRVSEAFTASKGNIASALAVLLTAPEFFAKESRGTLIKSPVHLLVGTCRLLDLDVTATPSLAQVTAAMGQELFNPPNVKGWPGGRDWISSGTLAVRYHLPEALFDGTEPGGFEPLATDRFFALPADETARRDLIKRIQAADQLRKTERKKDGFKVTFTPAKAIGEKVPEKAEVLVDVLLARLLAVPSRPDTKAALVDAVNQVEPAERVKLACRLILMTPEYQLA